MYEIPGILKDEDALSAIRFYQNYKRMGMPFGAWAYNPNKLVEIVELLAPLDELYHPPII